MRVREHEEAARLLRPMARAYRSLVNRGRAMLDWGDYWYWLPPLEHALATAPLVYPLRYDILIRRDFFGMYAANRPLYRSDWPAFLELALQHPYYQWFEKARVGVYQPELLSGDRSPVLGMFEQRVRSSVELYDRIERDGFDPAFPIVPDSGVTVLPTSTGVRTGATYYMGDGCHRLACLLAQGHTSLPPEWVRVKCHRRLAPLDITSLLEPHVSIDWPSGYAPEVEETS